MTTPQLENGYTKIATQILQNLSKIRIPGEARQVLDVIFCKTYGFHKIRDRISLSQFTAATGLKKPTVCRAINKLITMNIIIKIDSDLGEIYEFQKDSKSWVPLSKKITQKQVKSLSKKIISVIKKDNASLSKKIHTKDTTTKDTYTKDNSDDTSHNDIVEVIDAFKVVNPSYKKYFGHKTHRAAASRLIKEHGKEKILSIISYLPRVNGKPYAPIVTNAYELEEKLGKLIAWSEKTNSKKSDVIV